MDEGDDVYELFNLSNDPLEKNNLAAKEPEKVDELLRRLDIYTNDAVAPLYKKLPKNAEPTPKTWRPFWWLKE